VPDRERQHHSGAQTYRLGTILATLKLVDADSLKEGMCPITENQFGSFLLTHLVSKLVHGLEQSQ